MKQLKYAITKEWYNLLLLLAPFLVLPFIWDQLPGQIPTHWNLQGQVDGYSSKTVGLLMLPLLNIGLYLLMLYLPIIDPKKRIEIDQKPMPVLRSTLVVLLLGTHSWIILNGLGMEVQSGGWLYLGLSMFFVVMGNYLRTIKPNYFIGIRLPWTLENADNWKKTHKLGAYLWVSGGLILIFLFPFLNIQTYRTVFSFIVAILVVVPAAYSFYIYKKGLDSGNDPQKLS